MNPFPVFPRRLARSALAVLAATLLAIGCGGGGGGASDAGGSAFTVGTINGFGSIIVDGVRFDDSRAQVVDDDDQAHDRSELKLGMTVEVLSDRVQVESAGASAHASQIRFGAEIVGPVEALDAAAKQLTVIGQIVDVTDTTVFEDNLTGGLAALVVGDVVEVHAQFNSANGHYVAKRIEKKAQVNFFRLRGVVSNLDATAKTFHIGGATLSYAQIAAADLPPTFGNGSAVRVRLQTATVAGVWQAVSIRSGVRKVEDHDEARVRGIVTDFTGIASFSVNGLTVTTSAATAFPDGTAGIAVGVAVEVEGAIRAGVLVASKVELEDRHAGDDDRLNELHGTISALDTAAQTFVVREVKVHYSGTTGFSRGSPSDLANGKAVEVKGRLASDGVTLEAKQVQFEQ
jgi:hypothetical protein